MRVGYAIEVVLSKYHMPTSQAERDSLIKTKREFLSSHYAGDVAPTSTEAFSIYNTLSNSLRTRASGGSTAGPVSERTE